MYGDVPAWLSVAFLAGGLALLAWSSDFFVDGAAGLARAAGVSPFIVGMVVIGFGTSAPELCVSAMSGASGHANLSVGNAYGSCVFNIGAILGLSAAVRPIRTKASVAVPAGCVLAAASAASWLLLADGSCSRADAWILLAAFAVVMPAYCAIGGRARAPESEAAPAAGGSAVRAAAKAAAGLALLVASSHVLVWGAVDLARAMGVGELAIGLTIVAAGTSLPELASAVAAARRGESDFVLGNIVGSNLFNTLAVVGLAAAISPAEGFSRFVLSRDMPCMAALSASIAVFGAGRGGLRAPVAIGRLKGLAWLAAFAVYAAFVVAQEMRTA